MFNVFLNYVMFSLACKTYGSDQTVEIEQACD